MSRRTILALDLGTKTGWALGGATYHDIPWPDHKETHGAISFANPVRNRFEGGGMRYLRFRKWLYSLFTGGIDRIDEIYFEEVRNHLGVDASHAYGGFLATLTSQCENHCIPYQGIPVGTIKKYIAGKGSANKQMVIDAVNARGYNITDHNEADAMALLLYVESLG